jgi:hypothetical protein
MSNVELDSAFFLQIDMFRLQSTFVWRQDTQHNDIQHNAVQHNDIQHNNIQHNDIQHNDIQHNDIQHNDIQDNDIQDNDIQHNDTQHIDTQHYNIQHNNTYNATLCGSMLNVTYKSIILSVVMLNVMAPFSTKRSGPCTTKPFTLATDTLIS